jgi:hypothetical protein
MVEAPGIENSLIISRHHATRCNILQNQGLTPTDGEDAKSASSDIRQVYGEESGGFSQPADRKTTVCLNKPPGKKLHRRRWLPLVDDRGFPVVEHGFAVTTDAWRIEQIGRTVLWLQARVRCHSAQITLNRCPKKRGEDHVGDHDV